MTNGLCNSSFGQCRDCGWLRTDELLFLCPVGSQLLGCLGFEGVGIRCFCPDDLTGTNMRAHAQCLHPSHPKLPHSEPTCGRTCKIILIFQVSGPDFLNLRAIVLHLWHRRASHLKRCVSKTGGFFLRLHRLHPFIRVLGLKFRLYGLEFKVLQKFCF